MWLQMSFGHFELQILVIWPFELQYQTNEFAVLIAMWLQISFGHFDYTINGTNKMKPF